MTIGVVVVGLGWAGRSIWLPRLAGHHGYEVIAAVDPDPGAREATVRAVPGVDVRADLGGLDPDAIGLAVVAVPNHLHTSVAGRLLTRGIPVFVEKPVCLTSAEAEELAAAETAGGAVLLAGSAARYRGDVRRLTALVRELGEVRHVDLSWVRARGVPEGNGWFTDRSRAGGGALVDLGWHLLDTLSHVVGPHRFTHVVGSVSHDFVLDPAWRVGWRDERQTDERGDVEDTARGFLVSDTGLSVSLHASWASHATLDETRVVVEGSLGTAMLRCTFGFSPNRLPRPVLTVQRNGETTEIPLPDEPIGAEYDHQLDELPGLLAAPSSRGRAVAGAHTTIGVIERFYASSHAPAEVA
jgi:oxidoreductase